MDTPYHAQVFNVIFCFYTVLTPCTGFYNSIVYFQPRYSALRAQNNDKTKMDCLCRVLNNTYLRCIAKEISQYCAFRFCCLTPSLLSSIVMAWLQITFLLALGLAAQSSIAFSSIRNGVGGSHHFNVGTKLKLKSSTTLNVNDIPTQSSQQPIERVAIVGAGKSALVLFYHVIAYV